MSLRVVGEFNNISEGLKKLIVPLKPGQFATYKLTSFQKAQDPETREVKTFYRCEQFHAKDTIFDPFYKSPDSDPAAPAEGRTVEIGVPAIGGVDLKEKMVTKVVTYEFNDRVGGLMILSGNNLEDRELHEFLQITNRLENGVLAEHRDSGVEAIYSLQDKAKESKTKNKLMRAKGIAISYVDKMTAEEMREFSASKNWNYRADQEILSAEIYDYAEKYPVEFADEVVSVDLKRKAVIKIALEEGRIMFDPNAYKMMWKNGDTLAQLERKEGRNEIDAFNEWLSHSQNGVKIFGQIKKEKAEASA